MDGPAVALVDVLATDELARRPERPRSLAVENAALRTLLRDLPRADDPFGALLSAALDICAAGSAGVSMLEPSPDGAGQFRWVAMAGAFASFVGRTTPGDFSPCGVTLARGRTQLFSYPERLFTYFRDARPAVVEGLVIPFTIRDQSGTIWILAHDEHRQFTAGDAEFMSALADFTATAISLQDSARRERAAREQAEQSNRLKDEFLATVCHELRTPLHAIVGWSDVLADIARLPDDAREAIAGLRRAATRQSRLVEDLLDTSRIVSGHHALELTATDFWTCVESALETVRPLAAERDIALDVSVEVEQTTVIGDAARLQQAITNVLANATKFTACGGAVRVDSIRTAAAVTLRIADTGTGIDAAFLPHVFEPFRQADSSTQRRHGGLGLGLAIARDIIAGHGGVIAADSPGVGRGATFTITLPAVPIQTAPAHQLPQAPAQSPHEAARLGQVSILLVDDDADARDVIARILRRAGATVRIAASAAEAFDILGAWPPDLLVSDIAMPDEDGFALIARERREFASRRMKAAALSARTLPADRERALSAGFDAHLSKPLSAADLVSSIAALLDAPSPVNPAAP